MNSASAWSDVVTLTESMPGRSRAFFASCSTRSIGVPSLKCTREIHGIAQVAGGEAQIVDDQREAGGQGERDADHDEREQRGERRAREPAQRAEQRLQMPGAIGRNRAAHVRRSMLMLGRSASFGATAVMRDAARRVQRVGGDAAGVEHDFALAELLDQVRIVRGDDDGDAHFLETLENPHDLDGEAGIEIARGLVGDQQLRLADDRARDADALLLSHRQLRGR